MMKFVLFSVLVAQLAVGIFAQDFKNLILNSHNSYRQNEGAGLGSLSWSSSLASDAQQFADKCNFGHSSTTAGENVYMQSPNSASESQIVNGAMSSWMGEKAYWTNGQDTGTCSKEPCGHYTQIVWKETTKLGCALSRCPNMAFVVCQYSPAGNLWTANGPRNPY